MSKPGTKITISIELGNDDVQTYADVVRAIANGMCSVNLSFDRRSVPQAEDAGAFRDANGNTVGRWIVE